MITEFRNLNESEINLMLNVPALVTLLIAGAEGKIDDKETDWGAKVAHFRAEDKNSLLQNYYKEVDNIFVDSLKEYISVLPEDVTERTEKINSELAKVNDIMPKLDKNFAAEFYKGILGLSKQVAKADGGIWGYGSVSPEEQKLIDLDVINPPEA
ncbi:MAG TPA: hypothetical protein PKD83_07185 [Ignavibacteria bacterium]|nr:hypothetical protein [Ignavibacteria bacterium]